MRVIPRSKALAATDAASRIKAIARPVTDGPPKSGGTPLAGPGPQRLLAWQPDNAPRAWSSCAAAPGCRISQALALAGTDLDRRRRTMLIRPVKAARRARRVFSPHLCGSTCDSNRLVAHPASR